MNKKVIIAGCIAVLIVCAAGYVCWQNEEGGGSSEMKIDSAMKEAAMELKNSDNPGISEAESEKQIEENAAMSVMGFVIDKAYFKYRVSLYSACGSSDPVEDAVELMKQQAVEWKFAKENGLLPLEEEIRDYCDSIRQAANSDEENREIMEELIKSMGLTEGEYFDIIQSKYEAPFIIVSKNIENFCRENNINKPDWRDIEAEIMDADYIKRLRYKY